VPPDARRGRQAACAAALDHIDAIVDGNLAGNAARQGALLLGVLRRLAETSSLIGRVHGRGLLIGIELMADKQRGIPLAANDPRCEAVVRACAARGLGVHLAASTLVVMPPLTLTPDETVDVAETLRTVLS
jgi:4-aminobutyrate aminotransferase-like enzyme